MAFYQNTNSSYIITQETDIQSVDIPYILPCCGKTFSTTAYNTIISTTNICPLCQVPLLDSGYAQHKLHQRTLEKQNSLLIVTQCEVKKTSPVKRMCVDHPSTEVSFICLDDNALLCFRCISEKDRHIHHQIEELQPCLELLKTDLGKLESKIKDMHSQYKKVLEKCCRDMIYLMAKKLSEKKNEIDVYSDAIMKFQRSSDFEYDVDIGKIQNLNKAIWENETTTEAEVFESNLRNVMEKCLSERLSYLDTPRLETIIRKTIKEDRHVVQEEEKQQEAKSDVLNLNVSDKKLEVYEVKEYNSKATSEFEGNCVQTLHDHKHWVLALQQLPSGDLISASPDNTIKVWNYKHGTCLKTIQTNLTGPLCLQLLDSNEVATGCHDSSIRVWSIVTGACLRTLQDHTEKVRCLLKLPIGQMASGSEDNTIRIWDYKTTACIKVLKGHSNTVRCLQLLPIGELVSGSHDSTIRIWNYRTGTTLKTLMGHSGPVRCLQLLDSMEVASGSVDRSIKIWDCKTGLCQDTLEGHIGGVICLQLLASKELVSGSHDASIKIWDRKTGECRMTLQGHAHAVRGLLTLSSGELASCSDDKTIKIWE